MSTFPIHAAHTLSTVNILKQIPTTEWTWCLDGEALLSSPLRAHSHRQHVDYITCTHRDDNRVDSSTVLWRHRHMQFGGKMLNGPKTTLVQLARTCRLQYDLYQHGRNRAKGGDSPDAGRCHYCRLPDSLEHIVLKCQHSSQRAIRKQGIDEFHKALDAIDDPFVRLTILRIYSTSLNVPHGYLIWCGVWTDALYLSVVEALTDQLPPHYIHPKNISSTLSKTLRLLAQTALQLVSTSTQSYHNSKPSGAMPSSSQGDLSNTPVHKEPAGPSTVKRKKQLAPSQRTITSFFSPVLTQHSNGSSISSAAAAKRVQFIYLDSPTPDSYRTMTSEDLNQESSELAESSSQFTFNSVSHSQDTLLSTSPPEEAAEALKSQPLSAQLVRGSL